jgi:hypothetical protein
MTGYDDGRGALTEAYREATSFATRLERTVSIAAATSTRHRLARVLLADLERIRTEIDAAAASLAAAQTQPQPQPATATRREPSR